MYPAAVGSSNLGVDAATLPFNARNAALTEAQVRAWLSQAAPIQAGGGAPALAIRDLGLYRKSMVHRSYCTRKNESFLEGNALCPAGCAVPLQEESNERLEFLGDAVLNLVVGQYLYERYPDENEGFLTKMRTKLVNGAMLAQLAEALGFGPWLLVSRQIEEAGGRQQAKLLEDAFEAFLGALYLDHGGGFDAAYAWVTGVIEAQVDFAELVAGHNNAKDVLLKHCQHTYSFLPVFKEVGVESGGGGGGGSGSKVVTVCVKDKHGAVLGTGKGATRKAAEVAAAKAALAAYGVS
jgi:ribonuclease III